MNAIRALIWKDLLQRFRSPVSTVVMMLFPLVLIGIIGMVFRPGSGAGLPPTRLLIENNDSTFAGRFLESALHNERVAEYVQAEMVEPGTGEAIVASGDAAALLVIPENFSRDFLKGVPTGLTLIKDPGKTISPEIAEGFAEILTIGLSTISRIFREPLDTINGMMEEDGEPSEQLVANVSVLIQREVRKAERLLLPPAITIEQVKETEESEEESDGINIFAYIFPGMLVLGLLFVGQISIRDLVLERETGHMARLIASPTGMGEILFAKFLATLLLLVICHILVAGAGALFFRIAPGNPAASLLMVFAEGIAIAGLLVLLFSFAKTERQGETISSVVIICMSILGGSMFPLDMFPETMQKVGKLTLNYWAIEGFREVIIRGGTVASTLPFAGVLIGLGLVTGAAGSILLPRSLRRGI